jgi:hypothetical protein
LEAVLAAGVFGATAAIDFLDWEEPATDVSRFDVADLGAFGFSRSEATSLADLFVVSTKEDFAVASAGTLLRLFAFADGVLIVDGWPMLSLRRTPADFFFCSSACFLASACFRFFSAAYCSFVMPSRLFMIMISSSVNPIGTEGLFLGPEDLSALNELVWSCSIDDSLLSVAGPEPQCGSNFEGSFDRAVSSST